MALNDRSLERGLSQLDKLIAWAAEHQPEIERNEAATRFDLIDRLLLDVLAWPRDQVRPEEHSRSGYADYVLGRPRRQLVVEAKRESRGFRLPPEAPRKAPLGTLFRLDPDLQTVVEQAKRYADDFGLPYAAVTNGWQLVAFLAVRLDGVAPLKGQALAFPSLAAMRDGFADLWDGLSRPGVEGRRLSAMLGREGGTAPPPKPSVYIPGYPGQAPTDPLLMDLRMLGELFLIDLVEHPAVSDDFLRQCYLASGALSQHAAVGKQVLRARYSQALEQELEVEIASARTRKGVPEALLSDVATASLSTRPIILLGYVGVGKTMFVRHLVRVDAKDVLASAIVLYVNLGNEPALEELEPFIAEHFISSLATDYGIHIFDRDFAREVYAGELAEFDRGPWGELAELDPTQYRLEQVRHLAGLTEDREAHLRRSLQFLGERRRRQIVTILDNVDQRPAQIQDRVFLIAETLAKSWPGTVFVSLRPDTFNRSKRSGTLMAYQPRVFAVSPPRIDRLLDRRITFAKRQIARRDPAVAGIESLANIEALDVFLEVVRLSLRRSKALAELVDNLSSQNAREALALLTTLLSSPHVRPQYAVERARKGSYYSIPFHQFLRAVMLGEKARYDPAASRVTNLFDISSDDGREHFLLPIIIALLRRSAEPGVRQGFVPASRVYAYCQDLGFLPEQVVWHLERGVAGGLIEPSPLDGPPELFRATATGGYLEQRLMSDVTYVDEVVIDTPIVDDPTRAVIGDAEVVSARMQRTDRFSRYLDDQWRPLASLDTGIDWGRNGLAIRAAVADVERRLEGNGVPGRRRRTEYDE